MKKSCNYKELVPILFWFVLVLVGITVLKTTIYFCKE
jgi:hypothetical protein